MSAVSYTALRQNLSYYLDQAAASKIPLTVTRKGKKENVVFMSEEEFSSWKETVHLLSSPRNAERLLKSIRKAEEGDNLKEHPLLTIPLEE